MGSTALAEYITDATIPIVSGCIAFGSTLALSTWAQKMVGVSTATKVVPSVLGVVTVCAASLASQKVALCAHEWRKDPQFFQSKAKRQRIFASSPYQRDCFEIANVKIPMHDIRVCVAGLLTFKLLGGRFWGIAPSSITNLGSFSRWSIPCGEEYATKAQRFMIVKMGKRRGCHTCGSRMLSAPYGSPKFVGDHMPPLSVAKHLNASWLRRSGLWPKVKFRFYPQCTSCSITQGTILGNASKMLYRNAGSKLSSFKQAANLQAAGGGKMANFHGLRFRVNHLSGGVLAGATLVGATEREIANGNPRRFKKVQQRIETLINGIKR